MFTHAAAMRYFTQALGEDDPGRKDMLLDISTEELSHLEVIGSLVGMLNKGAKGRLAEAVEEEGELFRSLQGAGNDSHLTQVLYGGGPALINSGGQLWNAGYIDSIGEPTADLRSNIAAEARAKIVYERLINVTEDPGVRDALTFLMTREMSHLKSFEKALYAIEPNFPPGKLAGMPEFQEMYVNTSQGEGDTWPVEQRRQLRLRRRSGRIHRARRRRWLDVGHAVAGRGAPAGRDGRAVCIRFGCKPGHRRRAGKIARHDGENDQGHPVGRRRRQRERCLNDSAQ